MASLACRTRQAVAAREGSRSEAEARRTLGKLGRQFPNWRASPGHVADRRSTRFGALRNARDLTRNLLAHGGGPATESEIPVIPWAVASTARAASIQRFLTRTRCSWAASMAVRPRAPPIRPVLNAAESAGHLVDFARHRSDFSANLRTSSARPQTSMLARWAASMAAFKASRLVTVCNIPDFLGHRRDTARAFDEGRR